MPAAFWNYWDIGPNTDSFNFGGGGGETLTNGLLTIPQVLDEFLDLCQATTATIRLGLSNTGHLTIDNNGGGNFTITWTDTALRDLLGFTDSLAGQNLYTADRRIRGAFYLGHGAGPNDATLGELDPRPELHSISRTLSLGGVSRTTRSGVAIDRTPVAIQFIDNTARYLSPAAATATTYALALGDGIAEASGFVNYGLTAYTHARDLWWDSTAANRQGWSDGRPVMYFATAPTVTVSAAPTMPAATSYSTWVFDEESCKAWTAEKVRPPKTTSYTLNLKATEYTAP